MTTRVVATGEIDLFTVTPFRDALDRAVAGGGAVEVDLSRVTFLDAAGLSALAAARRTTGDRLTVVGAKGVVRRVLELTGFI